LAGKYLLEDCLGIGGMGEVYRATNVSLGRPVAIKLLSPEYVHIEEDVLRFLREARAAAAVRHANVVDVLDVARDEDGTPFIVQELLSGEDLERYLRARGGKISYLEALEIMIPVADAVAAAHAHDVVHRDLKPANIFLAKDRNKITPKVLDFGACLFPTIAERSAKEIRMLIGTPHYMAPEQIVSKADVDQRSDVWALGVILYEMLVGETPFEAESANAVLQLVKTKDVPPLRKMLPDAPEDLEDLIAKCTKRERLERLENAGAVLALAETVRRRMRGPTRVETMQEMPAQTAPLGGASSAPPTKPLGVSSKPAGPMRTPARAFALPIVNPSSSTTPPTRDITGPPSAKARGPFAPPAPTSSSPIGKIAVKKAAAPPAAAPAAAVASKFTLSSPGSEPPARFEGMDLDIPLPPPEEEPASSRTKSKAAKGKLSSTPARRDARVDDDEEDDFPPPISSSPVSSSPKSPNRLDPSGVREKKSSSLSSPSLDPPPAKAAEAPAAEEFGELDLGAAAEAIKASAPPKATKSVSKSASKPVTKPVSAPVPADPLSRDDDDKSSMPPVLDPRGAALEELELSVSPKKNATSNKSLVEDSAPPPSSGSKSKEHAAMTTTMSSSSSSSSAKPRPPAAIAQAKDFSISQNLKWTPVSHLKLAIAILLPAAIGLAVVLAVPDIGHPIGRALRGDSTFASGVLAVLALVHAGGLCARGFLGERNRFINLGAGGAVLFAIAMIIVTFSASESAELGVPSYASGLSTMVGPIAPLILATGAFLHARSMWLHPFMRGEAYKFAGLSSVLLLIALTLSPIGAVRARSASAAAAPPPASAPAPSHSGN
jgi:serine/threonine protein kinase